MGIRVLLVVIAAACLPVSNLSAEATQKPPFEVRVVVPALAGDIGEVRLGGKTCRLVATAPASESRAVVFINHWGLTRNEEARYRELDGAICRLPASAKVEVWGSGFGQCLISGRFPQGWVVALTSGGPAAHPVTDLPLNPIDRIFSLIANRFVGRGPVRLFWLDDSSFSYLDGRGSTEHFISPIEDLLSSIGDAGLTVYPVLLSTGLDKAWRKQSEWAAEMLGSRVRFVQGEPGDTILRAIRESELGTVLTLEIPRLGFTWRGLPPRLEVVGRRDRQVLYSRPFVAAGEKAAAEEGPDGEFRSHLYRIVPRLAFHRFELVRTCGNRTSDADGAFLKLEGIHVACPRASCRTRVAVITTRSSPEPALSTRDHSVIFEQVGETGCAGPLSWPAGSRVLLYSPDANWLTQVNLP